MPGTYYGMGVKKGGEMSAAGRKKKFTTRVINEGGFRPADVKDFLKYGNY